MPVVFNGSAVDGKTPITLAAGNHNLIPPTQAQASAGQLAMRTLVSPIPRIDASASQHFGVDPQDIIVRYWLSFGTVAHLQAFYELFRQYRAGRYSLLDDVGQTFQFVEFRRIVPAGRPETTVDNKFLAEGRVEFKIMQP